MPRSQPAQTSLSIHLLKSQITIEAALRNRSSLAKYDIGQGKQKIGQVFVASPRKGGPSWHKYVAKHVAGFPALTTQSVSAVLFLPVGGRIFAITFGYGRSLLTKEVTEERFGLHVALNAIPDEQLRVVNKKSLDAFAHQTQTQAIREGSLRQFGVDLEQDIVQALIGSPGDATLGSRLIGKDALGITTRNTLIELPALLAAYLKLFLSDDFKRRYPEIDRIKEEQRGSIRNQLDELVAQKLQHRDFQGLWLAVPEIIDWSKVEGFRYNELRGDLAPDLHLEQFLEHVRDPGAVQIGHLRSRRAHAIDAASGESSYDWPVYKCLHAEITHGGDAYVLSDGRWFRIARDLVAEVDDFVRALPMLSTYPKSTETEDEASYNARVASRSHVLMDRKNIGIGGGNSAIEFCDLFSAQRELVHVKRYAGSGVLSHLFAQGAVSADALLHSEAFRREIQRKLPSSHKSLVSAGAPRAADFSIHYAIIGRPPGTKKLDQLLPFFSRVNLKRTIQRLTSVGFNVSVAWIPNS